MTHVKSNSVIGRFMINAACFLTCGCIAWSCGNQPGGGGRHGQNVDDAEQQAYEEEADSVDGVAVSHRCSERYDYLHMLLTDVDYLSSPSMLMSFRVKHMTEIEDLRRGAECTEMETRAENDIINRETDALLQLYDRKSRELELPSQSVIATLQNFTAAVRSASSAAELNDFIEPRRGVLQEVEYIYLCIDQQTPEAGRVRTMANTFKKELEAKKNRFGMK